jgi:hypothetical protein
MATVAEPMRALTVRQPWCWSILHGGKRVENRPRRMAYRGPLLLHAGARSRWDPASTSNPLVHSTWRRWLRTTYGTTWAGLPFDDVTLGRKTTLMPFGAVVALAEVVGCHHATRCGETPDGPQLMCSPWAIRDQWHIELQHVRRLPEPVSCDGALGLWRLPEDVEKAVREQLEVTARG